MNRNGTSRKPSADRSSRTDWARLAAMWDEEIDTSDIPELGPSFFANAIAVAPGEFLRAIGSGVPKQQITLRVDADVIDFFKKKGKGYQRMMNFALRAFMWREQQAVAKESAPKHKPRGLGKKSSGRRASKKAG